MITFKHSISLAALLISLPLGAMEREHVESGSTQGEVMQTLKECIKKADSKKFIRVIDKALGRNSLFQEPCLNERAAVAINALKKEVQEEAENFKIAENPGIELAKNIGGITLFGLSFAVSARMSCDELSGKYGNWLCGAAFATVAVASAKEIFYDCKSVYSIVEAPRAIAKLNVMNKYLGGILKEARVIAAIPKQVQPSAPNNQELYPGFTS